MSSLQVGCASAELTVPLFTDLYGYGPFLGRRNRGVRDSLYCRAASFRQGDARVIIISSDLVTMDPDGAWEVRTQIAKRLRMPATGILVCGTHTHSGPTISRGIGWGELDPAFVEHWKETAVSCGCLAAQDEEPVHMQTGAQPLATPLGTNRVTENGPTDPQIRWTSFVRPDNTRKLLVHNHGMHGVVFGPAMLRVSGDWCGVSNTELLRRGLAEHVLFLQGAAGNINTQPCCLNEERGDPELRRIVAAYTDTLEEGLANETACGTAPVRFAMKRVGLPCEPVDAAYLRNTAGEMRTRGGFMDYQINRMEEMALHIETGGSMDMNTDLQVLRVGESYVYAVPGELFVELGAELLRRSPGQAPLIATIANDNCRYFPTPETFAAHPDILAENRGSGYYEVHFSCFGRYRPKYQPIVGTFLVDRLLEMANDLS